MTKKPKKAVVLLSGGLDSATTLAIAKNKGFKCCALTFRYGQKHDIEINSAKKIVKSIGAAHHKIINISPAVFSGSALTNKSIKVPLDRPINTTRIPITYVPARNTIFLSYALAFAESIGAFDIFIGVNATDYSGYPDCRGEYIKAFEKMANLATAAAVQKKGRYKIHTPIIKMSKAQIIKIGMRLSVDYSLTHSCYNPAKNGRPCGRCDSCRLRLKGFTEAGYRDPLKYAQR
jgi:7-cyano-7-deazaguanine synthase